MQYFAALAAIVPLVAAHGFVQDPPARKPGTAFKAACGEQPYNQQSSDINGNVQGIMQVVGTDFDAAECNLWLCKGFQLDDNTDNVQSFALGETIPFKVTIAAPHTGYANVSVVKTSTNSVIGEPLIEFTNYASNAGVAANNSAFSVTIPDDLGSDCTTAGDCVLQWFWDAPDIDQTYESCVDFTIGGSSGSEPAVSSTPAAASSAAAASTVAAVSSKAVSEAASSAVTTALTAVTETPAVTTAEAPAATTSAAADDEECPADDDEADDGEDETGDDEEECPADDETDDGEDDSADDGEECPADDETDDGEDTEASITQAAVSVTQAASVTAVAQVSTTPAAQSGSGSSGSNNSGSGNSGHYSAVTSYVTVSAKPQTKHHTKYVTVTAAAPACTN